MMRIVVKYLHPNGSTNMTFYPGNWYTSNNKKVQYEFRTLIR